MQLRGALLAASLLALPIVASAQPVTGLYVGAGLGVNLMQNENVNSFSDTSTPAVNPGVKVGSEAGIGGVLSLGWGLGNGLRFEGEGDWRDNKFDNGLDSSGNIGASAGGWEQKFGFMANVLYDFVGLTPIVQPYVGVGIGYQWAEEQGARGNIPGASVNLNNDTKGAFAYQAILGLALPIAAAPGLAITAEYRFMGLAGDRSYSGVASEGAFSEPASVKLDQDYNHTFLVGFRYNFGQTAAVGAGAAAPAAAPAPMVTARPVLPGVLRLG